MVLKKKPLEAANVEETDEDDANPSPDATPRPDTRDAVDALWSDSITVDTRPVHTLRKQVSPSRLRSRVTLKPYVLADKAVQPAVEPDFEILEAIGEGGMGSIFAARQTSMDRTIAVKMIRGERARDEETRLRFLSEATVTGDLDHPNIVPIHALGANERDELFYAMKRVTGDPWSAVLEEKSLRENLEILLRVADAVAFAHTRGVIHMDLKPENVMLGHFGEVYVMDWGLAASVTDTGKAQHIRETATIGGTPAYMAPEMAECDTARIGVASDVYLLGGILFELLTGEPPHRGASVTDCLVNAADNILAPAETSSELMRIARKALRTDPAKRYESVEAFQQAIRVYQAHAESISLAVRARKDLAAAETDGAYETYAQALFGFREALKLWRHNKRALRGLAATQLAYGRAAYKRGDYDLAADVLDGHQPEQATLRKQAQAARAKRAQRRARMRALTYTAGALGAAVLVILVVSVLWIAASRDRAERAEQNARAALAQEKEAQERLRSTQEQLEQLLTRLGPASVRPPTYKRATPQREIAKKAQDATPNEPPTGEHHRKVPPVPARTKAEAKTGEAFGRIEKGLREGDAAVPGAAGRGGAADAVRIGTPASPLQAGLLALYRASLLQYDLERAEALAKRLTAQAASEDWKALGTCCINDVQVLRLLAGYARAAFRDRGTGPLSIEFGDGHVIRATPTVHDDGRILLREPGRPPLKKTVLDLSERELERILEEGRNVPHPPKQLILALVALARQDRESAKRHFQALGQQDPGAAEHARLLELF